MPATPAPQSVDCCSTHAPGVARSETAAAWIGPTAPPALGLVSVVSTLPPDSLRPPHPDLPDRNGAIRSAPLYTLHSALLI
jgi:hypothetical protein